MNSAKIMVVDDDRDIVESITIILESAGYIVIQADSSGKCLEILQHERPDLIILDIMMDTLTDGIHVVYELKSDPEYQSIPIIIISTIEKQTGFHINKEYIEIEEYLEKPIEPAVLLECVKKCLS